MNEDSRGAAAPLFSAADAAVRGIVLALALIGALCIVAGTGLAFYACWVVYQLFENPGAVAARCSGWACS